MNISQVQKTYRLVGILWTLAGLWGTVISLVFGISQLQMIGGETPLVNAAMMYGTGLLYIALHFIYSLALLCFSLNEFLRHPLSKIWVRIMLILSLCFIILSVIPTSSIGFFFLPSPLIALASFAARIRWLNPTRG